MSSMLQFLPEDLVRAATTILRAGGSEQEEAEVVADHLVRANLSGHDSHGIGMLPFYVRSLQAELLFPNRVPELVREDGSILVFDGKRGYGQAVGKMAMERGIERCQESGLALMTLRNAHHIGRVGTYGEQAIDAGLVSMHFVNVMDHPPFVAPFRGADPRFSTNPVCLAMPGTAKQPPVLLDMATSRIAHGKARVAHNKGVPVPAGSLIDADGLPTQDPGVLFRTPPGSLLPFGEHKGYGLALFGELFGGLLSGYGTVQPGNERRGSIINNMLTVLIDPGRLVDSQWMAAEIEAVVAWCKASPPSNQNEPVLVPGDPERAARAERAGSVPVDRESWDQIVGAAGALGVEASELPSP